MTRERQEEPERRGDPGEDPALTEGPTRRIDSRTIFRKGERRVVIEHEGLEYTLIITRNARLILNRAR